jgi:hypothetical protein
MGFGLQLQRTALRDELRRQISLRSLALRVPPPAVDDAIYLLKIEIIQIVPSRKNLCGSNKAGSRRTHERTAPPNRHEQFSELPEDRPEQSAGESHPARQE